jgi:hypothetical protein
MDPQASGCQARFERDVAQPSCGTRHDTSLDRGHVSFEFAFVMKSATKRPAKPKSKCLYCGRRFKPAGRGRPPLYCSQYHRQLACNDRRAARIIPMRLLEHDINTIHTKEGFKRAVISVLLEVGLLPPAPGPSRPKLQVIKGPDKE